MYIVLNKLQLLKLSLKLYFAAFTLVVGWRTGKIWNYYRFDCFRVKRVAVQSVKVSAAIFFEFELWFCWFWCDYTFCW